MSVALGVVAVFPFVAFCGSRSLSPEWAPLVSSVVRSVAAAGRGLCVGCSAGADALAVSAFASLPLSLSARSGLWVFAAGGPAGSALPPSVLGCVRWWAGGPAALPLRARLSRRSLACVRFAAASGPGAGLVCFGLFPDSRGSLLACRAAVACGLPVVVFPCGAPFLPVLGPGSWRPAGPGPWSAALRWSPASLFSGLLAC